MIAGIWHDGSGLGNQLARYIAVRCLALDKGYDFSMKGDFKGDFIKLDKGAPYEFLPNSFLEKKLVNEQGWDVREYDADILNVEDNTVIDGEFQDPKYFEHHLDEIRKWIRVDHAQYHDNICVINFRGGEYVGVPDLFLPKEYWNLAINKMKELNPDMYFVVHTDDPVTARKFFPDFSIVSEMSINWRAIRFAPYLILSNSSFAILPAILNENAKKIFAPKFWAGYNKGYWQLPQNNYKQFEYIHHED